MLRTYKKNIEIVYCSIWSLLYIHFSKKLQQYYNRRKYQGTTFR